MAFGKPIVTSSMAPAEYHRVPNLSVDFRNRMLRGVIASFYNEAARMANAGALGSTEFAVQSVNYPLTTEDEQAIRDLINIGAGQDLLNVQFFFDGVMAHGKAAIEIQVSGKPFNTELPFQILKTELPVDLLAIAYGIMAKDAPFNDAEMV